MFLDFLSNFIVGIPQLFLHLGWLEIVSFENYESIQPINSGVMVLYIACLVLGFAIIPYLIGSISIPRLYCKKVKGMDLQRLGSGKCEIGDVWAHVGKGHALACFALEAVKVAICMAFGFFALGTGDGADGAAVAAFFCVIGEILPIWSKMRGSRGFETAAIGLLILSPYTFGVLLLVFVIVFLGMRFRTPARLFPTLLYPLVSSAFDQSANPTMVFLSVGVVALMLFTHWKNVQGMFNREEPRIEFSKKKNEEEQA